MNHASHDPPAAIPGAPRRDPPTLSIIIPAYNEARRLGSTLESIRSYIARTGQACELIVVDDGSTDNTAAMVQGFVPGPLCVRLLVNPANRGKGYSVRRGMLVATGEHLLMCDADLSTPIEELEHLRHELEHGCDVVIGSRDLPDSRLDPPQPLQRRWLAWAFRALRRRLLLPALRDTQCGFKLFTRPAAHALFGAATVDGWLFDCEILALADHLGYAVREVGVLWRNHPHSRVNPLREALAAGPTLLRIRRRMARTRR